MTEIEGMELPEGASPSPSQDIRTMLHNGKIMQYCAIMQRKLNAIHILRSDCIISDKEYYILRHRIMRAANEIGPFTRENDQ